MLALTCRSCRRGQWAVPTGDRRENLVLQITQSVNDMIARSVKLHPERFVGIGAIPQAAGQPISFCLEELERCVLELGFVGLKINPDPGEGATETPHMGDEYWYPLYEKMVELDVPALIHGGPFRFSREPELGYFVEEEAVAAWAILRSPRVFQDFPNLNWSSATAAATSPTRRAGAAPFRMNAMQRDPNAHYESFDESMRRLYYDTVLYDGEANGAAHQGGRRRPVHLRHGQAGERLGQGPGDGQGAERHEAVHRPDRLAERRGPARDLRGERAANLYADVGAGGGVGDYPPSRVITASCASVTSPEGVHLLP